MTAKEINSNKYKISTRLIHIWSTETKYNIYLKIIEKFTWNSLSIRVHYLNKATSAYYSYIFWGYRIQMTSEMCLIVLIHTFLLISKCWPCRLHERMSYLKKFTGQFKWCTFKIYTSRWIRKHKTKIYVYDMAFFIQQQVSIMPIFHLRRKNKKTSLLGHMSKEW